eukprot:2728271-Lingulodinium_polyedra.AAC.1
MPLGRTVVLKNGGPLPERFRGAAMAAVLSAPASSDAPQEAWQGYWGWGSRSWGSWSSWQGSWRGWSGSGH